MKQPKESVPGYRGRIAPSPTGWLHLGHARTFWTAQERARSQNGTLVLRIEDLDKERSKPEFLTGIVEDLQWFGIEWQEGPGRGGPFRMYLQRQRMKFYFEAMQKLVKGRFVYPCSCTRKDIQSSTNAPHAADDEVIYPGTCRTKEPMSMEESGKIPQSRPAFSYRFRVPDGETISFIDGHFGLQKFVAGKDFGDFVVWRSDAGSAYQLAVVADDAAMCITEVVRGADLLLSTARQLLLYRALGIRPPLFYHCPLMTDEQGNRLAKRHDALSLRSLRAQGISPKTLRAEWF